MPNSFICVQLMAANQKSKRRHSSGNMFRKSMIKNAKIIQAVIYAIKIFLRVFSMTKLLEHRLHPCQKSQTEIYMLYVWENDSLKIHMKWHEGK